MRRVAVHQWAALGLAALVACVALLPPPLVHRWQGQVFDMLMVAPAPGALAVHVVELPRYGPSGSPWSRDDLALLLAQVDSRKPRVIGLDIVLSQACETATGSALAQATRVRQAPLVLGFLLSDRPGAPPGPAIPLGLMHDAPLWVAEGAEGPCPAFSAQSVASTAVGGDTTGRVRGVPAAALVAGRPYPGFALAIAALASSASPPLLGKSASGSGGWLRLSDQTIALDAQGQFLIAPSDPAMRTARRHAALDLIADPGALPERSIVLIGSTLPEAGGLRPSRIGPLHPTVHLQADAVEQLLAGTLPQRPQPWGPRAEALTALLGGGFAVLLSVALPPLAATGMTLGLIGLIWGSAMLFAARGVLVDPSVPSATILFAASVALLGETVVARRRAGRLSQRMRQHLPDSVVARLDRGDSLIEPQMREITALFTDIEGFTALTQTLPTDHLVALLDTYMTGVTAIVRQHGGMVDKVVGDAVHAFFNAPDDLPGHVDHAIECAVDILLFSRRFCTQPEVAKTGFGRTRIGVETGLAQLGDVGRGGYVDYTAHGNAINLAARLQEANKALGTSILIGPAAAKGSIRTLRPGPTINLRSFGPVQVALLPED